jgi:uncharacterized membrane protein
MAEVAFFKQVFGYICGQGRCFQAAGTLLPLCQRCLGLYSAAGFTGLFLFLSGGRRKSLPPLRVSLVHIVLLFISMLAGIHLIDPGAEWRFLFGAWSGHVFVIWLCCGTNQLVLGSRESTGRLTCWSNLDQVLAFTLLLLLTAAPLFLQELLELGPYLWVVLSLGGIVTLVGLLIRVILVLVRCCIQKHKLHSEPPLRQ